MARLIRLPLLIALTLFTTTGVASAATINVAEFRWDLIVDADVPDDPFALSIFSLTSLWDGPDSVTLFNNTLALPGEPPALFDDLDPFGFSQQAVLGVPAFASTNVSFVFEGQTISLEATLTSADSFAILQFDPTTVPEPGTLGLLTIGSSALALRSRRRRRR